MPNATLRVFEGYRHEVFNETERTKVFTELTSFLDTVK